MLFDVRQILFVSFLLFHRTCNCIQCYQCDSLKDTNCSSSLHPKYLKDCPYTHNYCRKINSACNVSPRLKYFCEKYYFRIPTEHITMRECAALYTINMRCYNGKYNNDGYQHICECNDERGCNKSSLSHSITNLLIIFTQIVYQLTFQFLT